MEQISKIDNSQLTIDNCELKSVVIVGRGAVGAIYCDAFMRCDGVDLRVAVDKERGARYAKEEFLFNGKPLRANYFTPQKGDQPADLIIIATKWSGYNDALDLIEMIVGKNTLILPLLNGLLPYELAEQRFGAHRVMRGYYIGHTASREGLNAHQDGAYRTVIGEKNNEKGHYSARLEMVISLFDRAGIKYRVDDDMERSRWLKFIINLGLNQTSALDGGLNYGQLRASKQYRQICDRLMAEGAAVADRQAINEATQMFDEARKLLDTLPDEDYSSMAQDIRQNRTTEWPIFGGHLLQMAQDLGIQLAEHKKLDKLIHK